MSNKELQRYNIWIFKESLNKLRELQQKDGISISTFIRIAIKEKLEKYLGSKKSNKM